MNNKNQSLYHFLRSLILVKLLIPGRTLPSKSSKEAPPPVLIWLTFSVAPYNLTKLAESPPPIIVVAPFSVALIKAFNIPELPFLNFFHSNTPIGPFQTIVYALLTASL